MGCAGEEGNDKMALVVLDPGHGGPDPGAVGPTGVREADINWAVCMKMKQYLERMGQDVVITRAEDECPSQTARAQRGKEADLLVSLHCNGVTDPTAHGTEAWFWPERYDSAALSWMLLQNLIVATNRHNRGVKAKGYTVLGGSIPSTIIELAFISNREEEQLLSADWYQEKCALALAFGVRDFVAYLRR